MWDPKGNVKKHNKLDRHKQGFFDVSSLSQLWYSRGKKYKVFVLLFNVF